MNIFIIHGTGGNPNKNWFPWLKEELEREGHIVFVPSFPTPKNQSLESWLKVFKDYEKYLDGKTIFIGHSLGPAFILSILEKLDLKKPIHACFFVAGFIGLLNNPEFDNLNKTFTVRKFNWEKIKKNCRNFFIINSDNDPYVPLEKGKQLSKNLGGKFIVLKNAEHINQEAGYIQFDWLLKEIKKLT